MATPLAAAITLAARRGFASNQTIGWISPESRETTAPFFEAFKAGMRAIPGGDQVRIDERYVTGGAEVIAAAAVELQQQGVTLIVAQGVAAVPVARAKLAIPVVFGFSADPVVAGIAQSLARPGGNATGVSFMSVELNPKRIDFLRAALPQCRRVALMSNALHFGEENEIAACQRAVQPFGVELSVHRVRGAGEIPAAVTRALDGTQALLVLPSASMVQQSPVIAAQCLARNIPLVSGWASIARAGALLTYGPKLHEAYKRVAFYVMRVLSGDPPGSLPIEQPSVFELVINMKTSKALGLTLPATLLAQADDLIE